MARAEKLRDLVRRMKSGRSKYRAIRTEVDGIKFHSKREAKRYVELKLLEKAGKISRLELQPRIPLRIWPFRRGPKDEPTLVGHYVADFYYVDGNDIVIEDVKGFKTQTYKLKKKIAEALYGYEIKET